MGRRWHGERRWDVVVPLSAVSFAVALLGLTQPSGSPIAAVLVALPTLLAVAVLAPLAGRVTVMVRPAAATVAGRATTPRRLPRESHPDCAGHVRARAPGRRPA